MKELNSKEKKFKLLTLGCRVNQYETQAMRENLLRSGFGEAGEGEKPTVFVVNTCTVTAAADRESRYLIRRCRRENPDAKVIVTGCYTERDHKILAKLPGVSCVVFNRHKPELAGYVDGQSNSAGRSGASVDRSKADFSPLDISGFEGRTRALLKVQDGCNHACSFCKVVLVRGKSRSRAWGEVLKEAERLRDKGFSEIVLTGIQLGAYGLDFGKKRTLAELLEELALIRGLKRIRLSSIEPTDVTEKVIEIMAGSRVVCPSLHIPMQSGSDAVLKAMKRRYSSREYIELIRRLKARLKSFILTTDVMVGFPGEADEDFEATVKTLQEIKPYKLHLFPYSPREGTKAFQWMPVSKNIVGHRMKTLEVFEKKWREEIHKSFLGEKMEILIEERPPLQWMEGRARNFISVRVASETPFAAGERLRVKIDGFEKDHLTGSPCV